jgi:hypothetical protein
MAANHPARHPARSLAQSHSFAGQLPGSGKRNANRCPRGNLQDNSQVGAQWSRNVLIAVHTTIDATSRETSRKTTYRNFPVTS